MGVAIVAFLELVACAGLPEPALVADGVASASAPLALSPDGGSLWVANPDADSVTRIDTHRLTADAPIPVGREPWAVAVAPTGAVVVMNRRDGTLSVLEGGRQDVVAIGPEPGGLALSPSGRYAYVTVAAAGDVVVVDLPSERVVRRVAVGRLPWSVAVTDDGDASDADETVIVTHREARLREGGREAMNDGKEGWLTLVRDGRPRDIVLAPHGAGFPNALEGLAVVRDHIWVSHLLDRPQLPRDFENTVSGALTTLSLSGGRELPSLAVDVNDEAFSTPTNFPRAVTVAADGLTAFVVLAGTNAVMGVDLSDPASPRLLGFWATGANPRGIVLSHDGARAYVMNYLSRDVSVLDVSDTTARRALARVAVAPETLAADELRGKILFNNANDPRISHLGWLSCASCHLDGGVDGTTWVTPDGLRQTMPLWRLGGTAPFHASATRDEVQDFEVDVEGLMGGSGLAPGPPSPELGAPNGGRSVDLDDLAAYVENGIRAPEAAPAAEPDALAQGAQLFRSAGCASCHGGPSWTLSSLPGPVGSLDPGGDGVVLAVLRDVGTFDPANDVRGGRGFDVPTLRGLAATAPYLHDGRAATLDAVIGNSRHAGVSLSPTQRRDLAAFLLSIDDDTPWMAP